MRSGWLAVLLAAPALGLGTTARADAPRSSGAIFAQRPLPEGSVSVFGTVGYPGITAGVRQGFQGGEVGVVGGFDYTRTTFTADIPARLVLASSDRWIFGIGLRLGAFGDLGADYLDRINRPSAGLRLGAKANFDVRLAPGLDLFAALTTPVELALTERGEDRYGLRAGGGVELGVADDYSVGLQVLTGPDLVHPRGGRNEGKWMLGVALGFGRRFF